MKFTLHVIIAIICARVTALAQNPVLLTAFTNPVPTEGVFEGDLFGDSVAALGSDQVLISAPGRVNAYPDPIPNPLVYLFSTNGQLLTTFTNPAPADNSFYGDSVAAVGTDLVIIGTYQSGIQSGTQKVYLFSTNGALVTTFTNPPETGGGSFGRSVAALGSDRVVIGAPFDYAASGQQGLVHLFATNGEWLNTFTNPAPASAKDFGSSVTAVGSDGVLVGTRGVFDAGAAYLFDTNGVLRATFDNPTPQADERFGRSVASFGSDRVLIGAPRDESAAPLGGAAYLFSTNGVLLTTFTNPSPAYTSTGFPSIDGDWFGFSVAAVGTDRVLIGAYGNNAPNGTRHAGTAYLFRTNGTLLATLTHPAPTFGGSFGGAVAALGSDRLLIGAPAFALAATNSGRAYLFIIPPPPSLSIRLTTTNTVAVSWPSASPGFVLQQKTNGLGSVNWSNVNGAIQDNGTNRFIIVNPQPGSCFYRLVKP